MNTIWTFKPCDEACVEELFQSLQNVLQGETQKGRSVAFQGLDKFSKPLVALFVQRGCKTAEDVAQFMNPALNTLRDPFELPDMHAAVDRIRRALVDQEPITIFGDYDVDGVCSTALLVRVLRMLGGEVSAFIPNRLDDGYGLSLDSLAVCVAKNKPSLIITVDCGTHSVKSVEKASVWGIDVIITDHHEPGKTLAKAVAVVNPKIVKNHPDSILAGVGVAFKLCHALIKEGRDAGCPLAALLDLRDYLDFVAVATLTDQVPLLGENRALVRAGLQALQDSKWTGWNALKKEAGLNGEIETWHAGFTLGPRINAAGRIGRVDAALELLLTDLPARADEQARLLEIANRERQLIEKEIVHEALEEVEATFDEHKHFGLVIAREGWHIGVIGIVASRLVARYGRPVVVIGMNDGTGRGSCRSIEGFNMLDGLHACSDLLKQFGGHAMAAGLEIEPHHLDAFKERLNAFAAEQLKNVDLRPLLRMDYSIELASVDSKLMEGLKWIGPFGSENPEPIWGAYGIHVDESRILQEKHLKLTLSDGETRREAIGFNQAEKLPAGAVDIAFTLQENTWNGRTTLQLNLKEIRPARSSPHSNP